jgi:hypothetical protein
MPTVSCYTTLWLPVTLTRPHGTLLQYFSHAIQTPGSCVGSLDVQENVIHIVPSW